MNNSKYLFNQNTHLDYNKIILNKKLRIDIVELIGLDEKPYYANKFFFAILMNAIKLEKIVSF